jgi:hypothetical protein
MEKLEPRMHTVKKQRYVQNSALGGTAFSFDFRRDFISVYLCSSVAIPKKKKSRD